MSEAIESTDAPEVESEGSGISTLASAPPDAWYRDLPSDFHTSDTVRKHESLESFTKEAIHAQSLIGRKGVIPPVEDSTVEEWATYYGQLGRPEGLERYDAAEWSAPETTWPRDETYENQMLKEFYDAGLSETQAQKMWEFYLSSGEEQFSGAMQKHNELGQQLDERLTSTYGEDREAKLDGARRAWTELGSSIGASTEEWLGFLEQPMANGQRLGDQWPLIQAFVALGEATTESSLKGGKHEGFSESRALTPAAAQEELNRLMADQDFISQWADKKHAGHTQAVDEMNRLHEIIHGA